MPITSPLDPPGSISTSGINKYGAIAVTDRKSGRPRVGFVWRAGKITVLPTLGGTCSGASGISDHGHVGGNSCLPGDTTFHATLYRHHHLIDIDTFGGISSSAGPVNKKDQVAGQFTTEEGAIHSFFWQNKHWSDLSSLGGSETFVFGLSEAGAVTGQSDISNDPDPVFGIPPFHGFVWSDGVLTDMGQIFGSDFGYTTAVDSAGRIVGGADLAGDRAGHAYVWDHGTITDLSPYGDAITTWSNDVNGQGDIVGSWGLADYDPADGPPLNALLCPCYATVWHNGVPVFLDDLVDPQWHLLLGFNINASGDIVALGQFNGGADQRVLLKKISGAVRSSKKPSPDRPRILSASTPRGFRRDRRGRITPLQ